MKTVFARNSIALALAIALTCTGFASGDEKDKASDKSDVTTPASTVPAVPTPATAATANKNASSSAKVKDASTTVSEELQQLRELIMAQQAQIDAMRAELAKTQPAVTASTVSTNTLSGVAVQDDSLRKDVADLKLNATNTAQTVSDIQKQISGPDGPSAIRFKGITLTPGGFVAAETVYRSRAIVGDVNTPFNSVVFSAAGQSRLNDLNASGRQSRFSLLAEGKAGSVKMSGYYEADFLSAGTTSNYNQSNSFTLRQRQIWGQAALDNGWTFTGGQMWSLAAETRSLMNNRTEALPSTIDAQYHVGFSWERQYGFRVTKRVNDKFGLGVSLEQAQTLYANHNNPLNTLIGTTGVGGGLLSNDATPTFNKAPDVVFKGVLEPNKNSHFEVFAILRTFRTRVYPCAVLEAGIGAGGVAACITDTTIIAPSVVHAFNDTREGGGIGANGRFYLANRKLELGGHFLIGDGIGRYSTSTLPDVTSRGDGTLAPIRGGSALGTLELHPNPKLDIYTNIGFEYAARAAYINPYAAAGSAGAAMGYGNNLFNNTGCGTETLPSSQTAPGALGGCQGDTKDVIEGTLGFWHKIISGPKGTLRWGIQYSYLTRNAWSGTNNNTLVSGSILSLKPHGVDNMLFTSFRYYLP